MRFLTVFARERVYVMNIMIQWNALIGIFIAVWVPCSALAGSSRMTGQGEATAEDESSACESAHRRALRDVIERNAGVHVRSRTRVLQEHLVDEEIEFTGVGAVDDVRVEHTEKRPVSGTDRTLCTVTLSAVVMPSNAISNTSVEVVWCFAETAETASREMISALRETMKERGWTVHDNEGRCEVRISMDVAMDAPTVKTVLSTDEELMPLQHRSASMTLTTTALRDGQILGDPFVLLSAARFSDAAALNALRERSVVWAMEKLKLAVKGYDKNIFPESDVVLTISNVPDYGWASWLRAELKRRVQMFDSVKIISYENGIATLHARVLGGAQDVASFIGEAKSFRQVVRVKHVSGGKVDLNFMEKARRD